MALIKRIAVFCGSSGRVDEIYRAAATRLGVVLATSGIELIYGGGRVGLMGLLADAALASGGRVTGIIPTHLRDREVGHGGLNELIVVDSMHDRKRAMFERADAFVTLPGGLGTMDETLEIITWKQLTLHDKPILLVDVAGYWAPFLELLDHFVASGFAGRATHQLYRVVARIEDVLPALAAAPEPQLAPEPKLV
ncbi:MAG TPA: TIGR00730 family Rossman fold protein [Stellaceae bacterium]|nr:TIGR00730 family Rossman fold protein [Stellaceae bacterium]